jgi:hypothetical protein
MNPTLKTIQTKIYNKCGLVISDYLNEAESKEYEACRFNLDDLKMICRTAKVTPNKVGQFVAFYKRNSSGIIEPLNQDDSFDFYLVNVKMADKVGQFIFPKSILIKKGIISTNQKDGKRAFRVYPNWDTTQSKQAIASQKWQLDYFYEINTSTKYQKVIDLLSSNVS